MDERQALGAFGALSQETRLQIIRLLVVAGHDGLAAGTLATQVDVSPSNISFHLKELERVGLVTTARESRSIIYRAHFEALSGLARFLMEDCCSGHPEICAPAGASNVCCSPALKEKMQ
jgi:ArsR family transcriptional regulator